jgi:hypothetical protein
VASGSRLSGRFPREHLQLSTFEQVQGDQVCTSPLTPFSDSDFWWDSSASDVRANEVLPLTAVDVRFRAALQSLHGL